MDTQTKTYQLGFKDRLVCERRSRERWRKGENRERDVDNSEVNDSDRDQDS